MTKIVRPDATREVSLPSMFTSDEARELLKEAEWISTVELAKQHNVSKSSINRTLRWARENVDNSKKNETSVATSTTSEARVIRTPNTVTLMIDGEESRIISKDHPNYNTTIEAIKQKDYQKAFHLMDIKDAIKMYSEGRIHIEDDTVFIDGEDIGSSQTSIVTKILQMMREGDNNFHRLVKFIELAYTNPSQKVVSRIYDFVSAEDIDIDERGMIIGWKAVNRDYYDCYTGNTFKNTIGATISMPRNKVVDDENKTCSTGLHVCSKSYFKSMYACPGYRYMKVVINPRDVVSIPVDYNDAKMRCCQYIVIDEVDWHAT